MMQTGLCPYCGHLGRWSFGGLSFGYPSTGGDYEWMETAGTTRCPECKQQIEARVRVDLDDHTIDKLVWSPFPSGMDRVWYVVVDVNRWRSDDVQVVVLEFAATAVDAEKQLAQRSGAYQYGSRERTVLKLSAAGYETLTGEKLDPSAHAYLYYG